MTMDEDKGITIQVAATHDVSSNRTFSVDDIGGRPNIERFILLAATRLSSEQTDIPAAESCRMGLNSLAGKVIDAYDSFDFEHLVDPKEVDNPELAAASSGKLPASEEQQDTNLGEGLSFHGISIWKLD
jgi:hypothetical protein